MIREINDVYDLRAAYYEKHPNGHFFDGDTLKFFGERFSEMRLLKGTVQVTDSLGKEHTCYVVSSLQRIPMVGGSVSTTISMWRHWRYLMENAKKLGAYHR